jgi:hypothetical protein
LDPPPEFRSASAVLRWRYAAVSLGVLLAFVIIVSSYFILDGRDMDGIMYTLSFVFCMLTLGIAGYHTAYTINDAYVLGGGEARAEQVAVKTRPRAFFCFILFAAVEIAVLAVMI